MEIVIGQLITAAATIFAVVWGARKTRQKLDNGIASVLNSLHQEVLALSNWKGEAEEMLKRVNHALDTVQKSLAEHVAWEEKQKYDDLLDIRRDLLDLKARVLEAQPKSTM